MIATESISSLSDQAFYDNYYKLDKPVVIKGVHCLAEEKCTPEYIRERFWNDSLKKLGWYAAPLPDAEDDIKVPSLYRAIFESDEVYDSETPMRLWVQPNNNKTPWHYDVGGCHGFNLQIKGRKRWKIVSPNTPLPQLPMLNINAVDVGYSPDDDKVDCYRFIAEPGDMLFLPRGWAHTVETLEEVNINLNWLLFPLQPNLKTVTGRRECEIIKLISLFSKIGEGKEQLLARNYIEQIRTREAVWRLIRELSTLPRALYRTPNLIPAIKKYLKNSVGS